MCNIWLELVGSLFQEKLKIKKESLTDLLKDQPNFIFGDTFKIFGFIDMDNTIMYNVFNSNEIKSGMVNVIVDRNFNVIHIDNHLCINFNKISDFLKD